MYVLLANIIPWQHVLACVCGGDGGGVSLECNSLVAVGKNKRPKYANEVN